MIVLSITNRSSRCKNTKNFDNKKELPVFLEKDVYPTNYSFALGKEQGDWSI
jgi:hypothetical protein